MKAKVQMADQNALSYMARQGVSPQWRAFVRSLLDISASHLPDPAQDQFLRAVGEGMARQMQLPPSATLAALEDAMNVALAEAEWGYVEIALDVANAALLLRHRAAPLISMPNDPAGNWVAQVLEGLYQTWLDEQPGAVAGVPVRRTEQAPGAVVLQYARAA
jgi:hypothetical protein